MRITCQEDSALNETEDLVIREIRGPAEFEAALRIRIRVFVEEQGGPLSDEPDGWDAAAAHFLVITGGEVVGTARVYVPCPDLVKIGRVALLPQYRSRGWGKRLMSVLLDEARELGMPEVILDAQTAALPFYAGFGFRPEGEEFMDGGIPHLRMRLRLKDEG